MDSDQIPSVPPERNSMEERGDSSTKPATQSEEEQQIPAGKRPRRYGLFVLTGIGTLAIIISGFAGHWMEWWVKLIIAASILSGSVAFGEFLHDRGRKIWTAVLGGFLCASIVGGITVYIYRVASQSTVEPGQMRTEGWQPPELPEGCSKVFVHYGPTHLDFWIRDIKVPPWPPLPIIDHGTGTEPGTTNELVKFSGLVEPILPYVKDNRLYIFAQLPYKRNEFRRILMNTDWDSDIPPNWDRNYSPNAFEIVNERGAPVLQVIYRKSNEIQVNGIFGNSNAVIAAFGSYEWMMLRNGTNEWYSFFLKGTDDTGWPDSNVVLSVDAPYNGKVPGQKPIFKYPYWKHPGEFAE